jgi:AbrB family looped-hinge helix DNA binding protein
MQEVATTKLSSKGQVVIPEAIRKWLDLEVGTEFVVLGEGDVVVLRSIPKVSMRDFDVLIERARRQAKSVGLKRADIAAAAKRSRKRP